MPVSAVAACPRCQSAFPGALCNTTEPVRCPVCNATVLVEIFPAYFQAAAVGAAAEPILEEGVSSCFYHEGKKAVAHCDACGRFLCALCDLELGDRHLCPQCLQAGPKQAARPPLDNSRTLYDSLALTLALISFVPGVHFVTAPGAIGVAIYSLFKPRSLVRRSRVRALAAIILAVLLGTGYTLWMIYGSPS